jgi:hypothetical protein
MSTSRYTVAICRSSIFVASARPVERAFHKRIATGFLGLSHSRDLHLGHICTSAPRGTHLWPHRRHVNCGILTFFMRRIILPISKSVKKKSLRAAQRFCSYSDSVVRRRLVPPQAPNLGSSTSDDPRPQTIVSACSASLNIGKHVEFTPTQAAQGWGRRASCC